MKLDSSSDPSDSKVHAFGIAPQAPALFFLSINIPKCPDHPAPNFLLTRMENFILVINVTNYRDLMFQVNYLRIHYGNRIFNKNTGILQALSECVFNNILKFPFKKFM